MVAGGRASPTLSDSIVKEREAGSDEHQRSATISVAVVPVE